MTDGEPATKGGEPATNDGGGRWVHEKGALVQIPRRVGGDDPLNARRIAAIVALVGGLGLAWWTGRDDRPEVHVRLLLTHAAFVQGDLVLGPQRLSSIVVRVPAEVAGRPPEARQSWDFTPGRVPKLSPLLVQKMPAGRPELEVGCAFSLSPGAEPVRTWTTVLVDLERDGVQVVDVGTCGELEGPSPP